MPNRMSAKFEIEVNACYFNYNEGVSHSGFPGGGATRLPMSVSRRVSLPLTFANIATDVEAPTSADTERPHSPHQRRCAHTVVFEYQGCSITGALPLLSGATPSEHLLPQREGGDDQRQDQQQ